MDGNSMGPFPLEREATNTSHIDSEDRLCSLASLAFDMSPIHGFEYRARDPSPLKERCEELGGCELQRLMNCPVAVGFFRPLPVPPVQLRLRTACCDSCFLGASVSIDGRRQVAFDEQGCVQARRRRSGGSYELKFDGIPPAVLPGGSDACSLEYGPTEPTRLEMQVECPLYIYWLPPEEEDDTTCGEGETPEPVETTVCVACKAEDIPDEARPIEGQILCPGAEDPGLALDGISMGPFYVRLAEGHEESPQCLLAALDFSCIIAPPQFEYRARDPSPFLERCEELGGCEMQRLLSGCPSAIGYLRKVS